MIGYRKQEGMNYTSRLNNYNHYFKLTNSVTSDRGGLVPSYSRATTASVIDEDGVMRYVKSGETRFHGARRVENLLTNSFNLTSASWANFNGGTGSAATCTAGFTDPNGGTTAFRITATRGAGTSTNDFSIWRSTHVAASSTSQSSIGSVWIKSNTGVTQNVHLRYNGDSSSAVVQATNEWVRVSTPAISSSLATSNDFSIGNRSTNGDSNIDVLVWRPQLEDVTGKSVQSVSEYVSIGELSSTFHGAMVDGVKYFNTDKQGNVISSNTLLGYLSEASKTNECLYSETFDSWSKVDITVTNNNVVSPDGRLTADLITEGNLGTANISQAITTAVADAVYAVSCYFKYGNTPIIRFICQDNVTSSNRFSVWFNVQTGTILSTSAGGTGSVVGAEIFPRANGFYRVVLIGSVGNGVTTVAPLISSANSDGSVTRVNNATYYLWGAQFEDNVSTSTYATSYIPTLSSAVTRNSDLLNYTLSSPIVSGTIFTELISPNSTNTQVANSLFVGDGTLNNFLGIRYSTPSSKNPLGVVVTGGSTVATISGSVSSALIPHKTALRFATNDTSFAVDGSQAGVTDTSCNVATSMATIGVGQTAGAQSTIITRNAKLWFRQLSVNEIKNITR